MFRKNPPKNSLDSRYCEIILRLENVSVFYQESLVVRDVSLKIAKNNIVSFIGPSGCGKSTLLRCINRMNDSIKEAKVDGKIDFYKQNLYAENIDPITVRRSIGMVFQQPNVFPKSIYENIAYGARVNHYQGNMDELVEHSLIQAFLWNEVKDKIHKSALFLSGGQQQRLCIARAIALKPEIILLDEPCSALDPISTQKIEDLLQHLRHYFTIIIVTHNMQQAARISDFTAFFNVENDGQGHKTGYLVEYAPTRAIFTHPKEQVTQDYVSGKFG